MDFVMTSCLNTLKSGGLGWDRVTDPGGPGVDDGQGPGAGQRSQPARVQDPQLQGHPLSALSPLSAHHAPVPATVDTIRIHSISATLRPRTASKRSPAVPSICSALGDALVGIGLAGLWELGLVLGRGDRSSHCYGGHAVMCKSLGEVLCSILSHALG